MKLCEHIAMQKEKVLCLLEDAKRNGGRRRDF